MSKLIYLDNAATTRTKPEVAEAMLPYFTEYYGNPSSVYDFSAPVKEAVAKAREVIADSIGAQAREIYFTAGVPSRIIGRSKPRQMHTGQRDDILLPARLSTMRCCIPVNI